MSRRYIRAFTKRLSLDCLEFWQISVVVKDKAAVDARSDVESCFRWCFPKKGEASRRHSSHIRAWASALPSLRPGQCQKPQAVGRRRVRIPRFFIADLTPRRGNCGIDNKR